ncbi:MAG: hypothetical protein ACTHJT_17220 [Cytophaga sp.]|uniref:hypothetical protein n=1 Tax=Cytophaga sp. TaxID=29535 RepID=UPI003F7EEA10
MSKPYQDPFRYPRKSRTGNLLNRLLNNLLFIKLKRILFYPFSKTTLTSDVTNVVYLNWLVPFKKIEHFVPPHIRLKMYGDHVLFTILTYKHGKFGPAFLKFFKKIMGSPLQSNWRFYIENNSDFGVQEPAIFFIKNCIDERAYALGSRVCSNILLTDLPDTFEHKFENGHFSTHIEPGLSNAPDLFVRVKSSDAAAIPENFKRLFPDTQALIRMLCEQDFAVAAQPDKDVYAVAQIKLVFDAQTIQLLEVLEYKSSWLDTIVSDSPCFAFVIPELHFTSLKDTLKTLR